MTEMPTSLVDILQWRSINEPNRLAYRFLSDGEQDEKLLSYSELDRRARSIGALLQLSVKPGDRVLLLFQPGLDFIAAYFGCLYAKVLAVPAYPPHPARLEISLPLIRRISTDADAAAVLLNSSLYHAITKQNSTREEFAGMKLLVTDDNKLFVNADQWRQPDIHANDVAFLQYSSGSTTIPKGVMVTHKNLMHNLGLIENCFEVSKEDHGVIWLPPYHDMGLIGGMLQPIYSGASFTLLPHLMFLQRPLRWLQVISRFKATISGGPNFAYHLCIKKIRPEQREQLDLSRWRVAFNGAEPIYHQTLDQFADYFASCGFRKEAFAPCYGLAESTLFVVGGIKNGTPLTNNFLIDGIRQNLVIDSHGENASTQTMVSCGHVNAEQKIEIVNTETHEPCSPGEIGEIWINGNSVANGYWNKPAETELNFNAKLSTNNEQKFLRTGDLGFLHEDELYVTGRLKNIIISEGKNHYSHDIERTVEESHTAIRSLGCAAFSIPHDGHEDVIIVIECEHKLHGKEEEIGKAVREAVSLNHGLKVNAIKLTKPGSIPRTTSGKIKHFLCKQYYLEGSLKEMEVL